MDAWQHGAATVVGFLRSGVDTSGVFRLGGVSAAHP